MTSAALPVSGRVRSTVSRTIGQHHEQGPVRYQKRPSAPLRGFSWLMKQPSFQRRRAHQSLSDWGANHRPALPASRRIAASTGGGDSILLAARRAPPHLTRCSIIGASKPCIPCCFRFTLPPANPDDKNRINKIPQGPCWADGQSSRTPWATDFVVPFAPPDCLGRFQGERLEAGDRG